MVKTRTTDYSDSPYKWKTGYKGFKYNLSSKFGNKFKYEIGKTYHHEGSYIELCYSGFHFCRKLDDVFIYYENDSYNEYRYCLIEYDSRENHVIHENNQNDKGKSVTSSIRIVRELTEEEIRNLSTTIKVWRNEKKEFHREELDKETGLQLPSIIRYNEYGGVWYKEWWLNGKKGRNGELDKETGLQLPSEIQYKKNGTVKCEYWWLNGKCDRNGEIDPLTGELLPYFIYYNKDGTVTNSF